MGLIIICQTIGWMTKSYEGLFTSCLEWETKHIVQETRNECVGTSKGHSTLDARSVIQDYLLLFTTYYTPFIMV
jgi:hypothetical protein